MRIAYATLAALLAVSSSLSADPEWRDPRVTSVNTEPPHCTFIPCPDEKSALTETTAASPFLSSPWYKTLNGSWMFKLASKPSERPKGFYKESFDTSAWTEITVPSCWQQQGHGQRLHDPSQLLLALDPNKQWQPRSKFKNRKKIAKKPYVPTDYNPTGCYKRNFTIPDDWKGMQTFIHFAGVKSAFYIWVNGKQVGYSQGSMTPAEFNITTYLKPGENTVSAEVYRWCDGSYLEQSSTVDFSGIFREVYLFAAPSVHIRDFFIHSKLDQELKNAELSVDIKLRNYSKAAAGGCSTEISLLGPEGKIITSASTRLLSETNLLPGIDFPTSATVKFQAPKLWSTENPTLYTVLLKLKDSSGKTIECATARHGFRKLTTKGQTLLFNNNRFYFKGVIRPEHDHIGGLTISPETMLRDIELFKQYNINAVRTSHPADPRFYELCSQYGIIVIDEAGINPGPMSDLIPGDLRRWSQNCLSRAEAAAHRDKNHTCVIAWTPGNDAGENSREAAELVRSIDPYRPIHLTYTPDSLPQFADIVSPSSNNIPEMIKLLSSNEPAPLVLAQFNETAGNGLGGLDTVWSLIYAHPGANGCFINGWADPAISLAVPGKTNRTYYAYGRDFGVPVGSVPPLQGVVFPDRTISPEMHEIAKTCQPVMIAPVDLRKGAISIRNLFIDTNLDQLLIKWITMENGHPTDVTEMDGVKLAPGQTAILEIPHKERKFRFGGELSLRIEIRTREKTGLLPEGHIVAWEQFILPDKSPGPKAFNPKRLPKVDLKENKDLITVSSDNARVKFDKSTGHISFLSYQDLNYLFKSRHGTAGPELNILRAPIDNDKPITGHMRTSMLSEKPNCKLESIKAEKISDEKIRITTRHYYLYGKEALDKVTVYTIYSGCYIRIDNFFRPIAGSFRSNRMGIERLGLRMSLQKKFSTIQWYGRGPHENYSDRKNGAKLAVHTQQIDKQYVAHPHNQSTGNREDVQWLAVTDKFKKGFIITSFKRPFASSAVPWSHEDIENSDHPWELPEQESVILNIDYKHAGVNRIQSSFPPLLEPHKVRLDRDIHFAFFIKPFDSILVFPDIFWFTRMPDEEFEIPPPLTSIPEFTAVTTGDPSIKPEKTR